MPRVPHSPSAAIVRRGGGGAVSGDRPTTHASEGGATPRHRLRSRVVGRKRAPPHKRCVTEPISSARQAGELYFHLSRERRFGEPTARFYVAEVVQAVA